MSASTERLVEQIASMKEAIALAEQRGDDLSSLRAELKSLTRRLTAASEAMAEGRQILKD